MEVAEAVGINNLNVPIQGGLGALNGRAIQIISSTPVKGGVYSYGRFIGVIASIAIAILLIVVPLFFAFKAIYNRIRTHSDEIEMIRGNLAENRLQAILKVLPEKPMKLDDLRMNRSEYKALIKQGFTPEEIKEKVDLLLERNIIPEEQEEFQILAGNCRDSDEAYKEEFSHLNELFGKIDVDIEVIERLAEKGKMRRDLKSFLLGDGSLGTDPKSDSFKAGMELVNYLIGFIHDEHIVDEVNAIMIAIEKAPKENLEAYLQKEVRERIDILLQTPTYRLLLKVEGRKNQFVSLVQNLALAVRLESHGMEQLYLLGAKYLKKVKDGRENIEDLGSPSFLADALDDAIGKYHWSFKIESLFDKLLVYARYPEKTAMASMSHKSDFALDYNSYQVGNHDMVYGNYSLNGLQMRAINGPTPTSDHLLQGQLDAQREMGAIHLQHNLEHPAFSRGDFVRTRYLMSVEKEYPDTFRLMSTPLDGPVWSLKGEAGEYFKDYDASLEFFQKYATFAFYNRMRDPIESFDEFELEGNAHREMEGRKDNGFYIGPKVMDDRQFRLAFECAAQAFNYEGVENNPDKKRLTKALQVGVQGFIAVGAMIKTLQDAYPKDAQEALLKASFGQACKLDIDRGVVLNVITRVYFQIAAGNPLTEDDISEIIGTVIGRAELVSGRTIIADRYQPLSDVLRLIGGKQEEVREALQRYLQEGFDIDDPNQLGYQSSS